MPDSPSPAAPVRDDRFPPGIPYIVGNEGAERFSFYGMRQILYIYLVGLFVGFAAEPTIDPELLAASKVRATQITHLFMAGVYLFPMIGAILADRLLGKYRVILWVSLIYCAGHGAMALAGRSGAAGNIPWAESAAFAGLALIALGSGGIKPCVSANVGDQFTARNSHLVTRVFQVFYFIINFGSFFASLLTPFLYQRWGAEVAFGVPGVLMAVATLVFWFGRKRFVRIPPQPGGRLGFLDFITSSLLIVPVLVVVGVGAAAAEQIVSAAMNGSSGAVAQAAASIARHYWPYALLALAAPLAGLALFRLRQRIQTDTGFLSILLFSLRQRRTRSSTDDFWAPARRRFGEEAAEGPPAVFRILLVFSMVSVFWALFDQHSSTWIEQAKSMNLAFTVPTVLWNGWVVPGTILGALAGAIGLFRWVSNRPVSRSIVLAALAGLVLWGLVAAFLQAVYGGTRSIELLPAQIAALNPLIVMIVIPALNAAILDPCARRGRPLAPLTRMAVGMFIAASSFVAVALLQAQIDTAGAGRIHVFWQLIPFMLLTTAEVLVSVTGLEFAYTQAPRAMKSTILGCWQLCVTVGNVLVALLAPLQRLSLATFFWVFAGLMAGAAFLFLLLASRYHGKTYLQKET